MIVNEFNIGSVESQNFGVQLKDGDRYFIPVDVGVQSATKDMLQATTSAFDQIDEPWEEFSVSEEYGPNRRIFAPREHELMGDLSELYELGDLPDNAQLVEIAKDIDFYFVVFWDNEGRRIIGVKKATRFKGTLGNRNRLIRLVDNSLHLITGDVFRLDVEFDALIADQRVYILKALQVEYLAKLVLKVAEAAEAKLQAIQAYVPFLDLSGIAEKIGAHPRTARLAASVASRADLGAFHRPYIEQMAAAQGIKFVKTPDGRLKPRVVDQHKFMEILDDRRYVTLLTGPAPVPFRAPSRQRVVAH